MYLKSKRRVLSVCSSKEKEKKSGASIRFLQESVMGPRDVTIFKV